MGDRAADATPALQDIVASLYQAEVKQFDSQGSYGGEPWEAIQQRTIDRKTAHGHDPRILHETLRLRRSLTGKGGENVAHVTGSSIVFDTTVDYAKYLRDKRPLLGSPPESDRRAWVKQLQRFIVTGETRALGHARQPRNALGQFSR